MRKIGTVSLALAVGMTITDFAARYDDFNAGFRLLKQQLRSIVNSAMRRLRRRLWVCPTCLFWSGTDRQQPVPAVGGGAVALPSHRACVFWALAHTGFLQLT